MKTTLIAVSGMSPAIITETVWALGAESPPVVPDEVVIVTTAKGRRDIDETLLMPLPAWGGNKVWAHLRAEVFRLAGLPAKSRKLQLTVRVIDLPDEATGVRQPAEDLRTREDNDEAADFIVRVVDDCATDDTHVIASIAGGRKTMGALLYAAMSLRAKETDRVTHVLVSDPFENCRGFFYPEQPVQTLTATPFGKPPVAVQAKDAKIEMADIRFVPLRNKFTELREPRRTFAGLVECYAKAAPVTLKKPPRVSLDEITGRLTVEGRPFDLTGRDLLVAAFLFERATAGKSHFANKDAAKEAIVGFNASWLQRHPFHRALTRLSAGGLTVDDLPKGLNRIRGALRASGLTDAIAYLAPERSRIGFDMRAEG